MAPRQARLHSCSEEISGDEMVRPEGLEPPTLWFEARCSIQLSYGRFGEDRTALRYRSWAGRTSFGHGQGVMVVMGLFGGELVRLLDRGWIGDRRVDERDLLDEVEARAPKHLVDSGLGEAAGIVLDSYGFCGFVQSNPPDAVDLTQAGDGHGCRFGRRDTVTIEDVELGHRGDDSAVLKGLGTGLEKRAFDPFRMTTNEAPGQPCNRLVRGS